MRTKIVVVLVASVVYAVTYRWLLPAYEWLAGKVPLPDLVAAPILGMMITFAIIGAGAMWENISDEEGYEAPATLLGFALGVLVIPIVFHWLPAALSNLGYPMAGTVLLVGFYTWLLHEQDVRQAMKRNESRRLQTKS